MRALLAICLAGCSATLAAPTGEGGGSDRGVVGSCKPVDVLFAVDNSGSTPKEQQALREAFPRFASGLLGVTSSYRVGLVDGCSQPATLHTRGISGPCSFAGGQPWVESSSPTAVDEFQCVAAIDSSAALCRGNNDDEQPVTTAATALDPAWAGAGRPNAGFSRSDALLVVIAITDEDEQPVPAATAQAIHDRLVANRSDVVFVGIGGESECDGPYGPAQDAELLHDITAQFGASGMAWDLCRGDLDGALRDATDLIAAGCE
jgi:hypothetical protein